MVEGEIAQTLSRKNGDQSEEQYANVISRKTASLISCSCRVGALLGPQEDGEVEVLTDYGQNLGMAFQITDDVLDIIGDERQLGKSPGNDIREGKLTLPFIHTLGVADRKDRKWIEEVFKTRQLGAGILKKIRDMLQQYGGIEYSFHRARQYGAACKERLESLAESAERHALAQMADYVVSRVN
jgi:octaprenyl-diphosphate synthase